MPTLRSLPVETIHSIVGYLPTDDFCAFRQTCRDINVKTFGWFTGTYFQTRYVMLEQESLNTLIRISEHPSLGPNVRTLGLCTEHLPEPDEPLEWSRSLWSTLVGDSDSDDLDFWPGGDAGMWPEDDDDFLNQSDAVICRRYFDDQESFLSGPDVEALTRAMGRLYNCKTLVLTDAHTPWGAMRLEREAGELDRGLTYDDVDDESFVKHVLDVMLTAAKASNLPVEELCIELGQEGELASGEPVSFHLLDSPPEHMRQPGSECHLTSLTTLKLLANPMLKDKSGENELAPDWAQNLARFIGLFPQLSHFSLAFSNDFDYHPMSPCLFDMLSIPQLQKLELARLEVTEAELTELLLRHRSTLEEITLREVAMYDKISWTTLLGKIKHMPQVHSVTLKDCWLFVLNHSGVMYDYELDAVHIRDEQDFEEAIAKVEEQELIWNLEEETDGRL